MTGARYIFQKTSSFFYYLDISTIMCILSFAKLKVTQNCIESDPCDHANLFWQQSAVDRSQYICIDWTCNMRFEMGIRTPIEIEKV